MFGCARKAKTLSLKRGFAIVLFTIAASARADFPEPGCSPTPVADFVPAIHAFVSDSIAPLKAAYLNPNTFELDPLGSDLAKIENETDPFKKRMTLSLLIRGSSAKQTLSLMQTTSLLNPQSPYGLYWINGVASVWNGPQGVYQNYSLADVQGMSAADLAAKLQSGFAGAEAQARATGQVPAGPRDFVMMAAYLKLTAVDTPIQFGQTVSQLRAMLKGTEKIQLGQYIGGQSANNYDYVREGLTNPLLQSGAVDPGTSAQYGKSIPAMAILSNLRTTNRLGVCRDIAPLQAQVLSGLGIKHVYAFSYVQDSNHATVVAQNPDNPREIDQFNYGAISKGDLTQGLRSVTRGQDYSTNYDFYTPAGKTVETQRSEFGNLVLEAEGSPVKDVFLTRPQGSIAQLSLNGTHSQYPIFVGQTSAGDTIIGIGNTLHYGDPNRNVVSVTNSVGVVYQKKETELYSDQKATFDALHANITTVLDVNSHWKDLKDNGKGADVSGRVTSQTVHSSDYTFTGLTQYYQSLPAYEKLQTAYQTQLAAWTAAGKSGSPPVAPTKPTIPFAITNSTTAEIGAEAKIISADGRTTVNARIASQFALGMSNLSAGDYNRIYHNLSYVTVSGEHIVLPEKLVVTFNTALGLRVFGPQILAQAGVNLPASGIKTQIGYQGALQKDAFTVAPGMERLLSAYFEKDFRDGLDMTASIQQGVGFSNLQPILQLGIQGSPSDLLKPKKKKIIDVR